MRLIRYSEENDREDWEQLVRDERRRRRQLAEERERQEHERCAERRRKRQEREAKGKVFEIYEDVGTLPFHTTSTSAVRKGANAAAPRVLRLVRFYDDDDDDAASTAAVPETLPKLNVRKLCSSRVRLQALTPAECETLELAVAAETVVEGPGYSLRGADFAQLVDVAGWLDDTLIDAYVKLINARNISYFLSNSALSEVTTEPAAVNSQPEISLGTQALAKGTRNRSYVFGSFFFKILCPSRARYNYSAVQRWTTGPVAKKQGCPRERVKIRILDYSQVFVPVNIGSRHWVLVVVNLSKKEFVYMDTLGTRDGVWGVVKSLRRWLADEVGDKYGEETMKRLDIGSWKTVENPCYMPHQTDSDSCGMFCLGLAERLELGLLPDFTQNDIPILRKRAALALHTGALPLI